MGNIKNDIVNDLNNDLYYEEQELVRIFSDSTIPYRDKVIKLKECFVKISDIKNAMSLVPIYIQEQQTQQQQPTGHVHPGQSHGE